MSGGGLREATLRSEARLTIVARDSAGVQRTSGGERFRVTMRGASAPHVDLVDVGDGTYDASYVAVLSGCYQLIVTLDGVHVPGSPFTVHVRASSAAAPRCVATGGGLREARAGERATFCIQAVDADGSQKTCGGDVFFGALVGPLGDGDDGEDDDDGAPIAVSDRRNGRHTGSYAVRAAGRYRLSLREGTSGEHVHGSPFAVTVLAGAVCARACTVAAADAVRAGEPASLLVTLCDAQGNRLLPADGRRLQVTFALAGSGAGLSFGDDGHGLPLAPPDAPYSADDTPSSPSPPHRRPPACTDDVRPSPAQYGEGLGAAFATELTARGRAGRTARVAADGGDREAARRAVGVSDYHVEPAADGEEHSAEVVFTASRAGSLDLQVLLNGGALGEPLRCEVEAAEAHPDGCVLRGGGAAEAVVGEPASVELLARDRFHNRVGVGGAAVEASLVAPGASPLPLPVYDNGGGSYSASYTAAVAGEHALHVTLGGQPILGSPFAVLVHAARTFAAACAIDVSALAAARVGEKTPVVVRARDAEGNWALRGGDEFRAVLADASGDEVEVALDDHGDGYYHGLVAPRLMGEHTLYVSLDDVDVQGSPHLRRALRPRQLGHVDGARALPVPVGRAAARRRRAARRAAADGRGRAHRAAVARRPRQSDGGHRGRVDGARGAHTRRRQRRRVAAGEARGRGARKHGARRPAHRDAAGAGGGGAHVRRSAAG